jgi:hypothetical protein
VDIPDAAMDGHFTNDNYRARFVEYLRLCVRWGGLPGLQYIATWRTHYGLDVHAVRIEQDIHYLTEGLLPF